MSENADDFFTVAEFYVTGVIVAVVGFKTHFFRYVQDESETIRHAFTERRPVCGCGTDGIYGKRFD